MDVTKGQNQENSLLLLRMVLVMLKPEQH